MHAKKRLGQNFLVGSHYPSRIIAAVKPEPGETILEIGPGHGAITEGLLESGARVVAIELDRDLIPELNSSFSSWDTFTIHHADALKVDYREVILPAESARVVANLPYYISTPLLQKLIRSQGCITEMTLMLQREVVERIVASPGGKEYGYLSALVQLFCQAKLLFDVPPGAFRPVPKVTSSVVQLRFHSQPLVEREEEDYVIEVMQTIFAQRRKTIFNNLRAGMKRLEIDEVAKLQKGLEEAGIDPSRRGETLSLSETIELAARLRQLQTPSKAPAI